MHPRTFSIIVNSYTIVEGHSNSKDAQVLANSRYVTTVDKRDIPSCIL